MASTAKRPIDEFLLAIAILLVFPLLPLIMEFVLTIIFKSGSPRYLERSSVMLTAPILAVAVGMASRYKSIAVYCLIGAFCLAMIYGAQAIEAKASEADDSGKRVQQASRTPVSPFPLATVSHGSEDPSFLDRMDMDELPGRVAWGAMILVSGILIVERANRHLRLEEPLEFEWNK